MDLRRIRRLHFRHSEDHDIGRKQSAVVNPFDIYFFIICLRYAGIERPVWVGIKRVFCNSDEHIVGAKIVNVSAPGDEARKQDQQKDVPETRFRRVAPMQHAW